MTRAPGGWLGALVSIGLLGPASVAFADPGAARAVVASATAEGPTEAGVGAKPTDGVCAPGRAEAVAAQVQTRYDAIRDLSADFEQSSESVVLSGMSLGDAETTRGRVVFAKPGKMRWHYTAPEESFVISDGKTLWIYDVAAEQASRLAMTQGYLTGAALEFLLGDGKLVETFEITAKHCTPTHATLELLPRAAASYERLGLVADLETGLIVETTITDLFGNRTRIRFGELALDQAPDAARFRLDPPDGVEVIDLESAP